jgi:peptidoglycan/LPS O-acetylase OafA/YrhL
MIASPLSKSARKIPSLDGLRGVSILLVILGHARGTTGFPSWIPSFMTEHAALGVQIFFVISGYLITTLILDEERKTGAISLKNVLRSTHHSYLSSFLSLFYWC